MKISLGRNGGHLTPALYKFFRVRQEAYGTEQALRSTKLEDHTVEALLKIIDAHNLADAVDLAAWGHNELFLTRKEEAVAEGDFQDAKEAGVNVDSVEILSGQMMNDVSLSSDFFVPSAYDMFATEIWDAISRLPFPGTQPMAFKTCDRTVQTG
jgi:hypothetical protein